MVNDAWGHSYEIEMKQVTVAGYSPFDVATAVVDPAGNVWPIGVTTQGLLSSVADARADTWQFSWRTTREPERLDYNDLNGLTDPDNNHTSILLHTGRYEWRPRSRLLTDGTTRQQPPAFQSGGPARRGAGWCAICQSNGYAYQTIITHPDHQVVTDTYQLYEELSQAISSNLAGTTYSATTQYSYNNSMRWPTPPRPITDPMGNVTTDNDRSLWAI